MLRKCECKMESEYYETFKSEFKANYFEAVI